MGYQTFTFELEVSPKTYRTYTVMRSRSDSKSTYNRSYSRNSSRDYLASKRIIIMMIKMVRMIIILIECLGCSEKWCKVVEGVGRRGGRGEMDGLGFWVGWEAQRLA